MSKGNEKIDITYIGYSEAMIRAILQCHNLNLKGVISGSGKLSEDIMKQLTEKKIEYNEIDEKKEIYNLRKWITSSYVLMYKFGFIIPRDIISNYIFFNIHQGDLRNSRGAHSLRWAIMNGEKEVTLTLYVVNGIDEGYVVTEKKVCVHQTDDYLTMDKKMDKQLDELLEEVLLWDEKKEYPFIEKGRYMRKLEEMDYTINLETDDYLMMKRKVNAVKDFGGAVVHINEKKYRVHDVNKEMNNIRNGIKIETRKKEKVTLEVTEFSWQ